MIILFHLIRNKFMRVITYSTNFAPPHFAARSILKNTPHGTMKGHTAYIYMLSVYPFRMELFFFFSIHKAHTFARPDTFCKVWKRLGNAVCTLARRECTNQLTHQVSSEGQLRVSICCRGGAICQVI